MNSFHFLPLAKENKLQLQANWPHPKFTGAQLPVAHQISQQGFNALWHSNHFSVNTLQYLEACHTDLDCISLGNKNRLSLGVDFINPVDIYLKTERSLKYAFLLIGLSFMVFFIIEQLKGLVLHPIQYSFAGLAIAAFYLLLLALAEHIGFALAYAIAALACSSLLFAYLLKVLKSKQLAINLCAGILGLWALLYLIIKSEDFALLLGSLLVFSLLTILMLSTRTMDWYKLSPTALDKNPKATAAEQGKN